MNMGPDDDKRLQGAFEAKTADKVEQNYAATPETGKALVQGLRALLKGSATAARLFDVADQYGASARVLRGREETAYVPEGKWIFISVTPKSKPNPTLALVYAGAIREVEQNIMGFTRPGKDVSDEEWTTENVAKNLDIIKNMCRIVTEIEKSGGSISEFLDSLASLGHDEIYKAFLNGATDQELVKLLAKAEGLEIIGEG